MSEAIAILKCCGAIILDEQSVRNAEDDEPMACIVLDIAQRDKIVAEIDRLRATLKSIADQRNEERGTVTPEMAWEAFGKANARLCAIYEIARNAYQQSALQEK